jgi:hypothetical protein
LPRVCLLRILRRLVQVFLQRRWFRHHSALVSAMFARFAGADFSPCLRKPVAQVSEQGLLDVSAKGTLLLGIDKRSDLESKYEIDSKSQARRLQLRRKLLVRSCDVWMVRTALFSSDGRNACCQTLSRARVQFCSRCDCFRKRVLRIGTRQATRPAHTYLHT